MILSQTKKKQGQDHELWRLRSENVALKPRPTNLQVCPMLRHL